ncbi:uncharacterized protein LOC118435857 [Folsomia candida]|uniref:uncharacterized protein LOC118435857 n=1 Tax=Folsomia candida TaxID=158441 RepID=UPI001604D205|nr:uncharacterized protein LOC118435857 [Folsomia candida]
MKPQGEISVVDRALNNPIILIEILKRSPLKKCRLVCQFWNELVLTLPNTKLALNLEYEAKSQADYNGNANKFSELCFTLDDRLAKRISATCISAPYGVHPILWIDPFAYRLTHFCYKFSDIVQIFEISFDYAPCLPSIFQILKNYCPNLKQFRIAYEFFDDDDSDLDFRQEILPNLSGPLLLRPKLTLLTVRSDVQVTPPLANLLQLVVNASPNLREVTIPWGFYPDFASSKHLSSLRVELDARRTIEDALVDLKPSELSRSLSQVGDQLINLTFSGPDNYLLPKRNEAYNLNNSNRTKFKLPRKMSKLQKFENNLLDVFQHQRLDIGGLPALKTLKIGKILKKSRDVDELFENINQEKMVLQSMRNLTINEMHNPKLLEGLKTTFPNLESLELNTRCEIDFKGEVTTMNLDVVLNACKGWEGLKYLNLRLPNFSPNQHVIQSLLDRSDLYKELKTLEILIYRGNYERRDLTKNEMQQFKKLLVAMDVMNRVSIHNIFVSKKSRWKILNFMVSNGMSVTKFKIFQGGLTCRDRL